MQERPRGWGWGGVGSGAVTWRGPAETTHNLALFLGSHAIAGKLGRRAHSLEEWLHFWGHPETLIEYCKRGEGSNIMDEEKQAAAGPMCCQSLYLMHNRDMTPCQCQAACFRRHSVARESLFIDWYNFPDVRTRVPVVLGMALEAYLSMGGV